MNPSDPSVMLRAELEKLQQQVGELQLRLDQVEGVAEQFEVVTCLAGTHTVAVPLEFVERVVLVPRLLPLPDSRPWQPGCLVLEGEPIPVTDVAVRLQGQPRELALSDVVLIARLDGKRVGLLVQDASGVWTVARSELTRLTERAAHARFVLGLIPIQDRLGMLLSIRALTCVDS